MAEGYVQRGGQPLKMDRNNMKYWDASAKKWKTPGQACYYDGTKWVPFIRNVPVPGTMIKCEKSKDSGSNVFYVGVGPGDSNNFYMELLSDIEEAGYDANATAESGGDVTLHLKRASDTGSTRNIGFEMLLTGPRGVAAGYSGIVNEDDDFSIVFPKHLLSNAMYLLWFQFHSDNPNVGLTTGWEIGMRRNYSLEF